VCSSDLYAYVVTGIALVLTFGLIRFQQHVVEQTGSTAVGADRLHYAGDMAANIAVLIAFVLTAATGIEWFDPAFALLIAGGMVWSAVKIMRQALVALMDTELPDEQRAEIIGYVRAHKGVYGVHDLRTRSDGGRVFIELHVEMDGAQSLKSAHDLAERIMADLRARLPNADVVIHQDPAGHEEPRLDRAVGG
jgi:ferrous-iron efflux pump FieF